jgi:putative ABC transport system permease protein
MLVLRLVLRALRWRAAASITVFAVGVIAVLSATVGPIYLHATNQVVLSQRLNESPQNQRDVRVIRDTLAGVPDIDWQEPVNRFAGQLADSRWFGKPVVAEHAAIVLRGSKSKFDSRLAVVDGQCQHLTFTAGRCPNAVGETVISARTAATDGWRVGSRIRGEVAGTLPLTVQVVGIYQPVNPTRDFWGPWHLFDAAGALYDGQNTRLDSFFVDSLTMTGRLSQVPRTIEENVPLNVGAVGLDDRNDVRALIASVNKAVADDVPREAVSPTKIDTQLSTLLSNLNRETSLAGTLVTLATVQLALLAICVLYAIVSATAAVRGPEVALAKLRGRRPASILAQSLIEPAILILTAAVAGAALAWVAVRLVAPRLLAPHAPVTFPIAAIEVAGLATAAALLAAMVAARRIVVSPVADLLRRGTDSTAPSTGLAIADAVVVAIAVAGLIELTVGGVLTAGKPDPLSVIAPALLAIAVAIVGLRLLPYAGRVVLNWTRDSKRIVAFLAVRQIVRRASGTRLVLLISIALALATFAVTNWSVARSNREIRALNEAGAAQVLTVNPNAGVDLRTAVQRADPSGHDAMGAVLVETGNTPLLALDTSRMDGIAAWRADNSASSLDKVIDWLHPHVAPSVMITGTQVRASIDLKAAETKKAPVDLAMTVTAADHVEHSVSLGTLRPGPATYRAALPVDCAKRCRLSGLRAFATVPRDKAKLDGSAPPPSVRAEITFQLTGLEAADAAAGSWRAVDAGLGDARRWRVNQSDTSSVTSSGGALVITVRPDTVDGDWPVVAPTDVPELLPAVLSSGTLSVYPGKASANASATGIDGNGLPLDGSVHSVTLPELDRTGAMIDLSMAERAMTAPALGGVRYQVWLAKSAPADLTERLEAQGLRVVATDDKGRHLVKLDHTGPAFADSLFVVAAAAATILAIGATVLAGLVTARRRSYELAALEAVGVAPRSLRRATAAEQGLLLAVGLVLGVVAGIGGAVLALPSTPFFVSTGVGPPVEFGLPKVTLAVLGAGLVVLLALTCAGMARVIEGQATASRLREAQQ